MSEFREFLRATPLWYRVFLLVHSAWFLFVIAEWTWFQITGAPFWPVTP